MKARFQLILLLILGSRVFSGCVPTYKVPPELRCDPQPFPTTTAEILPWDWNHPSLPMQNGKYDFVTGICDAAWFTGDPLLETQVPCTGRSNDSFGMVLAVNQPNVEDNAKYEKAIWVRPSPEYCWGEGDLAPTKHQPYIKGLFGCINIDYKDRFHAWIGCAKDNPDCDITFRVRQAYYAQGDVLGEWRETYDGEVTEIDLDLSRFINQCIIFDLEVESNTIDVKDANALWIDPEIIKAK